MELELARILEAVLRGRITNVRRIVVLVVFHHPYTKLTLEESLNHKTKSIGYGVIAFHIFLTKFSKDHNIYSIQYLSKYSRMFIVLSAQ